MATYTVHSALTQTKFGGAYDTLELASNYARKLSLEMRLPISLDIKENGTVVAWAALGEVHSEKG